MKRAITAYPEPTFVPTLRSRVYQSLSAAGLLGLVAALAYAASGCAPSPTTGWPKSALRVAITQWPASYQPRCELPDLPEAPPLVVYERTDSVALERYYVARRDVEMLVEWNIDVKHWGDRVTACLAKLSRPHGYGDL